MSSSRTTADTPTAIYGMADTSLGITELEVVRSTAVTDDDKNDD